MKRTTDNRKLINRMMAESIQMPGFPQIVVTRDFLYQFLRECGWSPRDRGFGSLDYTVFYPSAVPERLTDEAERDRLLGQVRESYVREPKAA